MKRFMKKEADVEAIEYTGQQPEELVKAIGIACVINGNGWEDHKFIKIGEQKEVAISKSDFIVKDNGEFRIVKADDFKADYIELEEANLNKNNASKEPTDEEILASIEKGLDENTLKLEDLSEYDLKLYAKGKVKNAHSMKVETILVKLKEGDK